MSDNGQIIDLQSQKVPNNVTKMDRKTANCIKSIKHYSYVQLFAT